MAQLGSSAGAGRERSQGANLLTRHADHLLSSLGRKWAERIGIEPTSALAIDGDFEDREGHQAPFTLRDKKKNLRKAGTQERQGNCRTGIFAFLISCCRIFSFAFDLPNDGVEVGPLAGGEFGMEQFAIGADFECAAAGGTSVSDAIRSPSSRILAAKLTAFGA